MKRFLYTDQFEKLSRKLPEAIKKKLKRQLLLLAQNTRHPSLRVRKMVNRENVWEARIDRQYRLTFRVDGDKIILTAIGTHEIYRKS